MKSQQTEFETIDDIQSNQSNASIGKVIIKRIAYSQLKISPVQSVYRAHKEMCNKNRICVARVAHVMF